MFDCLMLDIVFNIFQSHHDGQLSYHTVPERFPTKSMLSVFTLSPIVDNSLFESAVDSK